MPLALTTPSVASIEGLDRAGRAGRRTCFRVRERRDVDLVLGQGILAVGWAAHTLSGPGKFLVSHPEHPAPKRARAYLVTDDDVAGNGTPRVQGKDRSQASSVSV
ncbi:MAG: hypothetical protein ACRDOI_27515 [Trebonia sp.]